MFIIISYYEYIKGRSFYKYDLIHVDQLSDINESVVKFKEYKRKLLTATTDYNIVILDELLNKHSLAIVER